VVEGTIGTHEQFNPLPSRNFRAYVPSNSTNTIAGKWLQEFEP